MQSFIVQLMSEHRFIEQLLAALGAHAGAGEPERAATAEFADYFRHYADAIHHGKEEVMLFREMERAGFQRDSGPLAVMLFEHGQGREAVAALAGLAKGSGGYAIADLARLREICDDFSQTLQNHIVKEDRVLYPLAMKKLPEAVLAGLELESRIFDENTRASGALARYQRLGSDLIIAHPVKCATVANWACNAFCQV